MKSNMFKLLLSLASTLVLVTVVELGLRVLATTPTPVPGIASTRIWAGRWTRFTARSAASTPEVSATRR